MNHSNLSEIMVQNAELRAECERLKAEVKEAKDQTGLADRLAAYNLKRVLVLQEELEQAKAENARLASSCAEMAEACRQICSPIRPHWRATLEAASTALNNYNDGTSLAKLLVPTIELLRQATLRPITWQDDVKAEIARLRALVDQEKATK